MIKIEEMPVSAQKAYKVTNIVRKAAMFIGWGLFVILYIVVFTGNYHKLVDFLFAPMWGAGFIAGMVHGEFIYKKIVKTLDKALPLVGLIMGVFISLFLLAVFSYIGFIFLIADTVLFFMKKPLVYPFEHKCFLDSRKAQEEIETAVYNEMIRTANSENAMDKLQKLKVMMEQGIITEDEFNRKKTELLDEI